MQTYSHHSPIAMAAYIRILLWTSYSLCVFVIGRRFANFNAPTTKLLKDVIWWSNEPFCCRYSSIVNVQNVLESGCWCRYLLPVWPNGYKSNVMLADWLKFKNCFQYISHFSPQHTYLYEYIWRYLESRQFGHSACSVHSKCVCLLLNLPGVILERLLCITSLFYWSVDATI